MAPLAVAGLAKQDPAAGAPPVVNPSPSTSPPSPVAQLRAPPLYLVDKVVGSSTITMPPVAQFDAAYWARMQKLSGNPTSQSNINFLGWGKAAYLSRLDLVQHAKSSILMTTYEIGADEYALQMLDAMIERAKAGVAVWFKFDGMPTDFCSDDHGNSYRDKLYAKLRELQDAGGVVARYSTEKWGGGSHIKVLAVDGDKVISGGRNLAEAYFSNWRDMDARFDGTAGSQIAGIAFHTARRGGIQDEDKLSDEEVAKVKQRRLQVFARLEADIQRGARDAERSLRAAPDANAVGTPLQVFSWDPCHNKRECPEREQANPITQALLETFGAAKKEIIFSTNYLTPTDEMLDLLCKLAKGDPNRKLPKDDPYYGRAPVSIRILTNGEDSQTHSFWPHLNAEKRYGRLIAAGVKIVETLPGQFHHGKMIVVDDSIAAFGSYNIEPAADKSLAETLYMSSDKEFVRQLKATLEERISDKTFCAPYVDNLNWFQKFWHWFLGLFAGIVEDII